MGEDTFSSHLVAPGSRKGAGNVCRAEAEGPISYSQLLYVVEYPSEELMCANVPTSMVVSS